MKDFMNDIPEIDVLALKKKIDANEACKIIDIREPAELAICKINNTIHIPMMDIPKRLNQFNKNDELIIQCKSGARSTRVCEFLIHQGFNNVKNLKGGILDWIRIIDPTQQTY